MSKAVSIRAVNFQTGGAAVDIALIIAADPGVIS